MRILILTEYFPDVLEPVFTGGVESRVFHLVEFLEKRHEVRVIKRTDNYSYNSLAAVIHRTLFFLRQLVKIISADGKYDVVEGTNFTTHILAFLYAKRVGAKAVAWYPDVFIGHGVERLGLISGMATELVESLAVRLPWDGVIALSGETKKKLIKDGLKAKKIETIYGGVKLNSEFEFRNSELQKFKKPTVICISRLVKYKRVKDLLMAIYFLRERFKDIRVIIVGDGLEKKNLFELCTQLEILPSVIWKKSINEEEKAELLRRSHVSVLPSVVEGFGLVTIESLASGTPVVNADTPINREILQKEEGRPARQSPDGSSRMAGGRKKEEGLVDGGLLFRAGDGVDLAEKIEILLTDKKLYNQKVSEGRELAKQYEWERINKQTEKFYQRLLSN